jgi:hypothetical protein
MLPLSITAPITLGAGYGIAGRLLDHLWLRSCHDGFSLRP